MLRGRSGDCLCWNQRGHQISWLLDIHSPHVTSVASLDGSTAVLPSSHSTQVWKRVPFVVDENSRSRQTKSSVVVPTTEAAHTDAQGEEESAWMETDNELKETRRRRRERREDEVEMEIEKEMEMERSSIARG